jgi:predicted oxidoreductase
MATNPNHTAVAGIGVARANLVEATDRVLGAALRCGPLGFGCWRFTHGDVASAQRTLEAALDAGMSLVDTADVYGLDWGGTGFGAVEELLGRVLAAAPGLRDRMVLATKAGIVPPVPYDSANLVAACDASLRRLGVDHVDVFQVHRPDVFTHPEVVADALAGLRTAGKVREVGVSNHTPDQQRVLAAALADRGVGLATTQVEYSAAHLSPLRDGTFDLAMAHRIGVLAWSPLAGGALVHGDGVAPALLAALDAVADANGTDRATAALAFALAHPCRPVVLVGSQDPGRLAAAARATEVVVDRSAAYAIVAASDGQPLP